MQYPNNSSRAMLGFQLNLYIGNVMIDMYVGLYALENARQVFEEMTRREDFSGQLPRFVWSGILFEH